MQRSSVDLPEPDRLADAHDLVGKILLHHAQEPAQALLVDVGVGHLIYLAPRRL